MKNTRMIEYDEAQYSSSGKEGNRVNLMINNVMHEARDLYKATSCVHKWMILMKKKAESAFARKNTRIEVEMQNKSKGVNKR